MKFALFLLLASTFTITEATTSDNLLNSSLSIDPSKLSFKFAVSWPVGFCRINTCKTKPADLPLYFTIHGLWPNYNGQCTDSTEQFDFKKLTPIYTKLQKYWPNIKYNLRPEQFWGNEWTKHGVKCNQYTVEGYFNAAISLYETLQAGLNSLIKEPYKTTPASIRNLAAFAGKKPFVLCRVASGVNYLEELRFCLNGNKQFVDCEPQASQDQYCSTQFKYSATLMKSFLGLVDEEFMEELVA